MTNTMGGTPTTAPTAPGQSQLPAWILGIPTSAGTQNAPMPGAVNGGVGNSAPSTSTTPTLSAATGVSAPPVAEPQQSAADQARAGKLDQLFQQSQDALQQAVNAKSVNEQAVAARSMARLTPVIAGAMNANATASQAAIRSRMADLTDFLYRYPEAMAQVMPNSVASMQHSADQAQAAQESFRTMLLNVAQVSASEYASIQQHIDTLAEGAANRAVTMRGQDMTHEESHATLAAQKEMYTAQLQVQYLQQAADARTSTAGTAASTYITQARDLVNSAAQGWMEAHPNRNPYDSANLASFIGTDPTSPVYQAWNALKTAWAPTASNVVLGQMIPTGNTSTNTTQTSTPATTSNANAVNAVGAQWGLGQ
jgi:hypothetical protein